MDGRCAWCIALMRRTVLAHARDVGRARVGAVMRRYALRDSMSCRRAERDKSSAVAANSGGCMQARCDSANDLRITCSARGVDGIAARRCGSTPLPQLLRHRTSPCRVGSRPITVRIAATRTRT